VTRAALFGLALLGAVAACRMAEDKSQHLDPATIVLSEAQNVRTDAVGNVASPATFVLFDVDNRNDTEALVTVGGEWRDAAGASPGRLRKETLRIPPRGRRTFALLDDELKARPTAARADVRIFNATVPLNGSPMRVVDGHVYEDQGRAVVAAYIVNDAPRGGRAIVFAGFHDAAGKPMMRPFELFEIGGSTKRPARFVGPPGSKTAYIFLGDIVY